MNNDQPTLGSLIRGLRTQSGWTLQEMSDKTGIPRSTLAKVEHGRLTLGYDKLMQLSKRLNIRMSELFASGDEPTGRAMTRRSVGTTDSAIRVETPNYEYFFLCPDLRKKRMIPIFGRVRAKSVEEFGELIRHPGEEFIYVLTGRVAVHTEYYEPVILEPGQCAYIDSSMGHAYILAPGCEDASLLAGCTSSDEELMGLLRTPESSGQSASIAKSADEVKPAKKPRRTKSRRQSPVKHRR